MAAARRPGRAEHHRAGAKPEYGQEPDLAVAEAAPELCEVYFPGEYGRVVLEAESAREGAFSPIYWVYLRQPRQAIAGKEYLELTSTNGSYKERRSGSQAAPVDSTTVAVGFEKVPLKRRYTLLYHPTGKKPLVVYTDELLNAYDTTPPAEPGGAATAAEPLAALPPPNKADNELVSYSDEDRPLDPALYTNINDIP